MLSEFGTERDCFMHGGKLIISHGGGGRTEDDKGKLDGKVVSQKQNDTSVRALMQNYENKTPLVLLVDDRYQLFPLTLSEKSVYLTVLGFYTIVDAWAESQVINGATVVRFKFAFQWCEGQGEPWWHAEPPTSGFSTNHRFRLPIIRNKCRSCHRTSPLIYAQSWACTNSACASFWQTDSGMLLPPDLDYDRNFLQLREPPQFPAGFNAQLIPARPNLSPANGMTTSFRYTRGWHCNDCGRVSCRAAFEQYQCDHCDTTYSVVGKIHDAKYWQETCPIPRKLETRDFEVTSDCGITALSARTYSEFGGGSGVCQSFQLPDNKGMIHHIRGSASLNAEADSIFKTYQQQGADGTLSFRRRPLKRVGVFPARGQLLSSYFSHNSTSHSVAYVGGTDQTVPFDQAPSAVVDARQLITSRMKSALGTTHEFNEVLSVAYLENQDMSFHSDDEKGLGPVVAGLSLGSPAVMHFRRVQKPEGQRHQKVLTILLQHGDILAMEGVGVQEHYQHTVIPENFRIAVTARHIGQETAGEGNKLTARGVRSGEGVLQPRAAKGKRIA
ncbi:hypothetical protein DFH09DRAFT_988081 [Mycena vulgaris]|nr:hypothetical protein DFH09DRAFT_988081 [Mycena vulgaris]